MRKGCSGLLDIQNLRKTTWTLHVWLNTGWSNVCRAAGIQTCRKTHKLLTNWRLSVKFSCPQLLKHDSFPLKGSWDRGSPRASAPSTRHSCLCLRSSSSHSPARLASRRSLVRLRSTVTGNEDTRCMPLNVQACLHSKSKRFRLILSLDSSQKTPVFKTDSTCNAASHSLG